MLCSFIVSAFYLILSALVGLIVSTGSLCMFIELFPLQSFLLSFADFIWVVLFLFVLSAISCTLWL